LQGDHKNASAFWAALKVQPIIQSGVQTWKALILVHTWLWDLLIDIGAQGYAGRTQICTVCLLQDRTLISIGERQLIRRNGLMGLYVLYGQFFLAFVDGHS